MPRKSIIGAGIAALAFAATAIAAPGNGGFEKGNFDGWDRLQPGGGKWQVYTDMDGFPYPPPAGDYAAAVTQNDPGLNILHRKLNAKNGRFLSFQLAYDNSGAGEFATPKTFKYDGEFANQQLRVDLLRPDAKIKSLDGKDILNTPFRTKETSELFSPYELYVVDLKEEGIKGKFRFRVAEVDNQQIFFVGLDQVFQSDLVP